MKKKYTIAETFVGAGGSHLGFKNMGFETVYVNEFNDNCLETLLYNNPELKNTAIIDHKDICDLNINYLSKKLRNNVDVLFGGVVCKSFSLAGERNPIDDRNYLYINQMELVKAFNPKVSIIENVPAFLTANIINTKKLSNKVKDNIQAVWKELENIKGIKAQKRKEQKTTFNEDARMIELRLEKQKIMEYLKTNNISVSVFSDIKKYYEEYGYTVYHSILNSAWYGSGTARKRAIIVAIRNDINKKYYFPVITHLDNVNEKPIDTQIINNPKPFKTVGECLAEIPEDINDLDNHPMKHTELTKKRFAYIPEGKSIQTVMDQLPKEMKISKFYSRGCTMRLARNKVSPTLVPGHSNFPVHPTEHRSITVKEAAVITGFPLNYKFFGSHTSRCEQVGNAVPINLSKAIAKSILDILK